jgi:hypothetical protein
MAILTMDLSSRNLSYTVNIRSGYNTVRITAPDITVQYAPKTNRIYPLYCRKYPVLTTFTERFRTVNETVLMDLGT